MKNTDVTQTEIDEINELHDGIEGRRALADAIQIGEKLVEVKTSLDHGQWKPWVQAHLHFNLRTAQRYMQVAAEEEALKSDSVTLLSEAYTFIRRKNRTTQKAENVSSGAAGEIDLPPANGSMARTADGCSAISERPDEAAESRGDIREDDEREPLPTAPTAEEGKQFIGVSDESREAPRGIDDQLDQALVECAESLGQVVSTQKYGNNFSRANYLTLQRGYDFLRRALQLRGITAPDHLPAGSAKGKPIVEADGKNVQSQGADDHEAA